MQTSYSLRVMIWGLPIDAEEGDTAACDEKQIPALASGNQHIQPIALIEYQYWKQLNNYNYVAQKFL